MIHVTIPLDNADGGPALIRFTRSDEPVEDWRRVHAFIEAQREPRSTLLITTYLLAAYVACLSGLLGWLTFG